MNDQCDPPQQSAARSDGYIDFLTSSGRIGKEPRPYYAAEREIDSTELANAYENDAVAARIIDQVVDDAIRADWDLVGLDKAYNWQSVKSAIDDLGAITMIGEAWRWARLYRGSLLVLAVDDGQGYDKPLKLDRVRALRGLSVVDATKVQGAGFNMFRGSAWRRNPEFYDLLDPEKPEQAKVHCSRVIRFDGVRVPPDRMTFNNTWGPSVLSRCWRSLANYTNCMRHAEQIMKRLTVLVLKMKGWRAASCGTQAQKDALKDALRELWWGVDNLNLLALDFDDQFDEVKRSIEGVKAMIDAAVNDLVMSSGTTRQVITGTQTSTGLNSDTKGERHAWYDHVTVQRRLMVSPALSRILQVEFAARRNRDEQVPDEWEIDYEPLEQEAQEDRADRATKWATSLSVMIDKKVISPEEARQKLVDEAIIDRTELGGKPAGASESAINPLDVLTRVANGELPAASAIWLLSKDTPAAEREQMMTAVLAAAERARSSSGQSPAPAQPGVPEAADEVSEAAADQEPDPIDTLLAEIPDDCMTAADIVGEIKRIMGLEISTRKVHALARKYKARGGKAGGDRGYSLRDIKVALAKENKLELPPEGDGAEG